MIQLEATVVHINNTTTQVNFNTEDYSEQLTLVNHSDSEVIYGLIQHGLDEVRNLLLKGCRVNSNPDLLLGMVMFGDSHIQNSLTLNPFEVIRAAVASFGNDKHRECLMHDYSPAVRLNVVRHGSFIQRIYLSNDEDETVRSLSVLFVPPYIRVGMVSDPSVMVRRALSPYARTPGLEVLCHDTDERVSRMARSVI